MEKLSATFRFTMLFHSFLRFSEYLIQHAFSIICLSSFFRILEFIELHIHRHYLWADHFCKAASKNVNKHQGGHLFLVHYSRRIPFKAFMPQLFLSCLKISNHILLRPFFANLFSFTFNAYHFFSHSLLQNLKKLILLLLSF